MVGSFRNWAGFFNNYHSTIKTTLGKMRFTNHNHILNMIQATS